mmetsp:Transcript_12634/g.22624  ORF Transcript_12634/g.22624 Transcript_12634/m.22624 type:complete len:403 (-) Transcript_12634:408-1616(-)
MLDGRQPPQSPSKVRSYHRWTAREERELLQAVKDHGRRSWEILSQSPKYPLLSCRSATMLKNKFYKMLRADQGTVTTDEKDTGEEQELASVETTNVTSFDMRTSSKNSESPISHQIPMKKVKREALCPQAAACGNAQNPATESYHFFQQSARTTEIDDALAMIREALAIQIDANKAVSLCIAARDNGRGDDDTVRAALHVASLAQEKASKARQILTMARQEHVVKVSQEENVNEDGMMMDLDDFNLPLFDDGKQGQQIATPEPVVSSAATDNSAWTAMTHSAAASMSHSMLTTPAKIDSGLRSSPCVDSAAILDACNFLVGQDWPHMTGVSVDKLWNDIQHHSLDGLACCKHHADMFGAAALPHGIDDIGIWDLANSFMPAATDKHGEGWHTNQQDASLAQS